MEFFFFHFYLLPFPGVVTSRGARDHLGNLRVLRRLFFKLVGGLMSVWFTVMFKQHISKLLVYFLCINYPII